MAYWHSYAQLGLHSLNTGRQVRVVADKQMLLRNQRHIGTYLMCGVHATRAHLYKIAVYGSTHKVPFCTMGSGTLAAMSVLESQ